MKHMEDVGSMTDEKTLQEIPDHVVESFARCLLPAVREYFDSEEGQREYTEWKFGNGGYSVNKSEEE